MPSVFVIIQKIGIGDATSDIVFGIFANEEDAKNTINLLEPDLSEDVYYYIEEMEVK